MTQKLQEVSIPMPGGQGLSSELTPFQPQSEFALRADNAVVDRVGRLAAREAFADYVSNNNFDLPSGYGFNVVRIASVEVDDQPPPIIDPIQVTEYAESEFGLSEYAGIEANFELSTNEWFSESRYNVSEYNGAEYAGSTNPDVTEAVFGLAATGLRVASGSEYNVGQYGVESFASSRSERITPSAYIGFTLENGALRKVSNVTPTHGTTNAQLVPFKDSIYIFSKGDPVMVFYKGSAMKLSDHPNYLPPQDDTGIIAQEIDGDIATAAYGRLWVSGVNGNYDTIYYSDLLVPHQWYDGRNTLGDAQNTAGLIDVREYWPNGNDKIQGLAAHNGFLVVFGRHSILIYSGAEGDPAGDPDTGLGALKLEDAIRDVGLVNQDAMCNIGSDHLFVDSLGVRALGRVVQEKSSPLSEPSMNVSTVIREQVERNLDTVRMRHLSAKSMAVCLFPDDRDAYVFRTGQPSASGGLKTTRWVGCDFYDAITVKTQGDHITLLGGMDSRGILAYDGYTQPSPYVFRYESAALNSGSLLTTMIPKAMTYAFSSDEDKEIQATWGFEGDITYSRKARSRTSARWGGGLRTSRVSLNGAGTTLRVGFDVDVNGVDISVQQISINTMVGRTNL